MDEFFTKLNFPYSNVRAGQDEFIRRVYSTIENKKNLLVSAPTGLGKTVSALAPAIKLGKKLNKTVVCLTSRQTQANQVIKTIRDISDKSGEPVNYVAFIGKRSMCYHEERDLHPAQDFLDFCKKTREKGKCKYYSNVKDSENEEEIKHVLKESSDSFMSVENFVSLSGSCGFCPYELAAKKAYQCDVVICDYNYLFASGMQEVFMGKIGCEIEDCIVIVDEAHNLPDRIRMSYSYNLSTELLDNALKELKDSLKTSEYDNYVKEIKNVLKDLLFEKMDEGKENYLILKEEFIEKYVSKFNGFKLKSIIDELRDAEALVKETKIISFVGRVANFLERWSEFDSESFLRVLEKEIKKEKPIVTLSLTCIDPGDMSGDILNRAYSSILMSGTLSPINMYKDILDVKNADTLELDSPFSKENQLTLVVDDVTSKYSARSLDMFKKIARNIEECLNGGFGKNALVFFPSYAFMDQVLTHLSITSLDRRVIKEQKFMTKEDKEKIVTEFKESKGFNEKAKVLFGVTSGSFSEGLDLPEDSLEMVIVVGLPLAVPDMFTNSIIRHFDKKFSKGELYGYIYPAMSKIIQAAGRCIRTETDRGVVVLMDNRFLWPKYALSFPKNWHMRVVDNNKLEIENFFDS